MTNLKFQIKYNFLKDFFLQKMENIISEAETIFGQTDELQMGLETLTYLKPYMTFTRPFKQSSRLNYESSADLRLRVLAMASGTFFEKKELKD